MRVDGLRLRNKELCRTTRRGKNHEAVGLALALAVSSAAWLAPVSVHAEPVKSGRAEPVEPPEGEDSSQQGSGQGGGNSQSSQPEPEPPEFFRPGIIYSFQFVKFLSKLVRAKATRHPKDRAAPQAEGGAGIVEPRTPETGGQSNGNSAIETGTQTGSSRSVL